MEPGDRIRRAREARNWSEADLARAVGTSQATIHKIEAGETTRSKFLSSIALKLELPLEQIDPGYAQLAGRIIAGPSPVLPEAELLGRPGFPIYSSVEGGPGQIILSTDPVDWAPTPAPVANVKGAYGLLVVGESMVPEYRPGDTAIIDPHLPVISGEVYIFYAERNGEARATIKHLRRATVDQWHVSQWNPPPGMKQDFTLSRTEWGTCHRVFGKYARR